MATAASIPDSLFKQHYIQIAALIEQGLSHEECDNYHDALNMYTKALQRIRSCLHSNVRHQAQDLEWVQKMKRYRDMFEPHVLELQAKYNLQRQRANYVQPQQQGRQVKPTQHSNDMISNSNSLFSGLWNMFQSSSHSNNSSSNNSSSNGGGNIIDLTSDNTSPTSTSTSTAAAVMHSNRLHQMQHPLHKSSNSALLQHQHQSPLQQPQHLQQQPFILSSPRNNTLNHANQYTHNNNNNNNSTITRPFTSPTLKSTTTTTHTMNNNNNNNNNNKLANIPSFDKIPEFKGIDKKLLDHILNEVVQRPPPPSQSQSPQSLQSHHKSLDWSDIAGLSDAKQILHETIVLPALRPDIFNGLRAPARGILLYGPPGTGKTLLAKVVSSQCKSTFFSISASSLVSKWVGEAEKLVKALFAAARFLAPSVIFIDEIDSMLTSRSSNEHEASRRLKTEFLVQIDGVTSVSNPSGGSENNGGEVENKSVLVIGATNRPFDLDDAILRRFTRRIYIPLPDREARMSLVRHALGDQRTKLSQADYDRIAKMTDGYSGSDLKALCQEAAMIPVREMGSEQLLTIRADQLRVIQLSDFVQGVNRVKPSVSMDGMRELLEWNKQFGTFS